MRFIRASSTTASRVSIASFDGMLEKTIILDGFSKTYSMTGWRLGYGVMPTVAGRRRGEADGQLQFLHRELHAAGGNRGAGGSAGLPSIRWWPNSGAAATSIVKGLNTDSRVPLPRAGGRVLRVPQHQGHRHGVEGAGRYSAIRGGRGVSRRRGFGAHGEGYLRFSYANSLANIMEAVDRIRKVSTRWVSK